MKTRDEISAMLGGFVDAKPDEQGTLIAGVLDEFDECRNEAEQFTSGCPDGASNWHEAYDNLRKDYVKAFLDDDNKHNDEYQKTDGNTITIDEAAQDFVKQMFGRKVGN